jgi:hypothetical protein
MNNNIRIRAITALLLVVAAGLVRYWIAPSLEKLPANYSGKVHLIVENRFRQSPDEDWHTSMLDVYRTDQTIKATDGVAMVEGSMQAYFQNGALNFETKGLYGIDRLTRANLTGFGDTDREGQYIFPLHVRKIDYVIWDPMFIGQRLATFDRVEEIDGLQVYVFTFQAIGMDETEGYSYLQGVPELYHVHTDGRGVIWVEPISGIVVDYTDGGVSYYVGPDTGLRLADFNQWEEQYTQATRSDQVLLARATLLRIQFLEIWLPGLLIVVGTASLWIERPNRKQKFAISNLEQALEDRA